MILALMAPGGSAHAAETVGWEVGECEEAVAILGDSAFGRDALLVITTYDCRTASIDGEALPRGLAVSEISVVMPDGESRLLRQVVTSQVLALQLRALGLADSFTGRIELTSTGGPAPGAVEVLVKLPGAAYRVSGNFVVPGPPHPSSGGAAYTYEGGRGKVRVEYENHAQSFGPGTASVDGSRDDALRAWLGGRDSANGSGLLVRGSWSGRATLDG